jgi:hypothetical protein
MNYILTNNIPNTACALSVSVFPQTAASISILPSGASGATTTALTPNAWNPIIINFVTFNGLGTYGWAVGPGTSSTPTSAEVGTVWTTNWAITTGYEPTTLMRGNLFVPYGQIHADDVVLVAGTDLSVYNTLNSLQGLRNYSLVTLNSSTWTTVYPIATGSHGWIKLNASGVSSGFYSMVSAYFERTNTSNTSLTLMAQSNNSAQAALNTTNSATGTGTMQITIQLNGNNIQAKSVPASMAVAVRVTLFYMLAVQRYRPEKYPPGGSFVQFGDDLLGRVVRLGHERKRWIRRVSSLEES